MADPRVLVIENDASDPVAKLGEWLTAAGAVLTVVRPYAGDDLPTDPEDFDAMVVMGGVMGAGDDEVAPWLPRVRGLLMAAVQHEVPTLGVCLGAQLLGLALGGVVERNPEGPEFGASLVAKRQAAAGDPLFRPLPITPDVLQAHDDAVTTLPANAELLASSPGCAVQAFRVGRMAWGLQFHIENTAPMLVDWASKEHHQDPERDLDAVVATAVERLPDIEETWAPFAASFVDIARDPATVKIARTVPSSTAEPISDKAAIRAALAAEADAARGGSNGAAGAYGSISGEVPLGHRLPLLPRERSAPER